MSLQSWPEFIYSISSNLKKKNVEDLLFLYSEDIPDSESESILNGNDLIKVLKYSNLISATCLTDFMNKLETIGRGDLCKKCAIFENQFSDFSRIGMQLKNAGDEYGASEDEESQSNNSMDETKSKIEIKSDSWNNKEYKFTEQSEDLVMKSMQSVKSWQEFSFLIAKNLMKKNIEDLLFLYMDDIPDSESEKIKNGNDLIKTLQYLSLLSDTYLTDFMSKLQAIGRVDLYNKCVVFETQLQEIQNFNGYCYECDDHSECGDSDRLSSDVTGRLDTLKLVDNNITADGVNELCDSVKCNSIDASQSENSIESDNLNNVKDIYTIGSKQLHSRCIIFNNKFSDQPCTETGLTLKKRNGTDEDANRLETLFKWLCFEVEVCKDYNKNAMLDKLKEEADNTSKKNDDCVVICVLSHGKEKGIYSSEADFVLVQDIVDFFAGDKCQSLLEKPKLFFVQACQGNIDERPAVKPKCALPNEEIVESDYPYSNHPKLVRLFSKPEESIAANADQFVFMATTPGNSSFRHPVNGSWFIQELCSVFEEHALEWHLYDLVLEINEKISRKFAEFKEENVLKCAKMMSDAGKNTLRKRVKFFPTCTFSNFQESKTPSEESYT